MVLPESMPELLEGFFCLGCEVWFQDLSRYSEHKCSDYDDDDDEKE